MGNVGGVLWCGGRGWDMTAAGDSCVAAVVMGLRMAEWASGTDMTAEDAGHH